MDILSYTRSDWNKDLEYTVRQFYKEKRITLIVVQASITANLGDGNPLGRNFDSGLAVASLETAETARKLSQNELAAYCGVYTAPKPSTLSCVVRTSRGKILNFPMKTGGGGLRNKMYQLFRVWGLGILPPIMENQMAKKNEHEVITW